MINLNKKKFRMKSNTSNGEVSEETIFDFIQIENFISANYSGGDVKMGNLIGTVNETGTIDMRYHHFNSKGILMTGKSISKIEILDNGKVLIHDDWQWPCGDFSKGTSTLEEI